MKTLLLFALLAVSTGAQDTVRVKHGNYESVFSKSKRYPVLVEWTVSWSEFNCRNPVKRTNKFLPDPEVGKEADLGDDYAKSGFDRGHISPAADTRCNEKHMAESFYFTNIAPQYPALNRGQWRNLEEWTRVLASKNDSVIVKAGCVGELLRIRQVAVPSHCWKVIRYNNELEAYVFPNTQKRSKSFKTHKVPLDSIKKLLGVP